MYPIECHSFYSSFRYILSLAAEQLTTKAFIILDTGGDGLASSDRGTLDVSDQQTDGTIQPRFLPAENPVAIPEPTPEPPAEDTTDAAADAAADGADLTADAPQDDTQSQE